MRNIQHHSTYPRERYCYFSNPFLFNVFYQLLIYAYAYMPICAYAQMQQVSRLAATASSVPHIIGTGYLGVLGVGANTQNTTRLNNNTWGPDGSAKLTFGLGNPEKTLGTDFRLNIYGISNSSGQQNNVGESTLDIHFSKKITDNIWAGIGGYDLIGWNASAPNKVKSIYGAMAYTLSLRSDSVFFMRKLYITAGVGSGRFRTDAQFSLKRSLPFSVFGSIAFQIIPEGNIIAEWSGYGLYSGFSLFPFKKLPFQMMIGYDDMLHPQRRFVLAGSLGFFLKKNSGNKMYLPPPPPPQSSRV
jgi:hypothetical protein